MWYLWHVIETWAQDHPLLLFVAAVLSLYAREIRLFLSIPPQRLSVWIRRYRLKGLEERLRNIKLQEDEPDTLRSDFYISVAISLMLLLAAIGLLAVAISIPDKAASLIVKKVLSFIIIAVVAFGIGFLRAHLRELMDEWMMPARKFQLQERSESLRAQLQPKDAPHATAGKGATK